MYDTETAARLVTLRRVIDTARNRCARRLAAMPFYGNAVEVALYDEAASLVYRLCKLNREVSRKF